MKREPRPKTPRRKRRRDASKYWRRRLTAVLVLALAAAGTTGVIAKLVGSTDSAAQAPKGPAPQTLKKAVWGLTEHNGVSMFPKYRDLGIGIFETQARWDAIAPTRPTRPKDPKDPAYLWPVYLDDQIREAKRHGMTVMVQVLGAPKWANGKRKWTNPPLRPSDYGDFAAAISKRYPSVRHWMIWGEANSKRAFGAVVDAPMTNRTELNEGQARAPRLYARIVDAAYGRIKGVNRKNLVIGGNTYLGTGRPVIRTYQWIRYMRLPDGRRPRMDMWGHNPYSFRKPYLENPPSDRGRVDFSDLGRLTQVLDRTFPGPPLKLYLSEWGVPTGRDEDLQFEVDPETAVKWVRSAFQIVREWDRIYTLGWSVPVDTPRNPQGLLDTDLEPKPTYDAFKAG